MYKTENVRFTHFNENGAAEGTLADKRTVLTQGIIPGETAEVCFKEEKKMIVQARLNKIINPSPKRITPPCPHFSICEGCDWQFLSTEDQQKEKIGILRDMLAKILPNQPAEPLILPLVSSPSATEYRKTITLTVRKDGKFSLPVRPGKKPFQIENCLICDKEIIQILKKIELESNVEFQHVTIRIGADDDAQILFHGKAEQAAAELSLDMPVSIVYSSPTHSSVLAGDSDLLQSAAGLKFVISDENEPFPNPEIIGAVCAALSKFLPEKPVFSAAVMNCGIGFWAKWVAASAKKVTAFDAEEAIEEDFVLNLDEFDDVALYIGDPNQTMLEMKTPLDLVLIDAAIGGFSNETLAHWEKLGVRSIFYFNESFKDLARDIPRLINGGYTLQAILPYDEAPQTSALSMVAIFKRN